MQEQLDRGLAIHQAELDRQALAQRKEAYRLTYQARQDLLLQQSEKELAPVKTLYQGYDWLKVELPHFFIAAFKDETITDESRLLSEDNMHFILDEKELNAVSLANRNQKDVVMIFETIALMEDEKAVEQLYLKFRKTKQDLQHLALDVVNDSTLAGINKAFARFGLTMVIDISNPLDGFLKVLVDRVNSNAQLTALNDIPYIKQFTVDTATAEQQLKADPSLLNKIIFNMLESKLFEILGIADQEKLVALLNEFSNGKLSHAEILDLIADLRKTHTTETAATTVRRKR